MNPKFSTKITKWLKIIIPGVMISILVLIGILYLLKDSELVILQASSLKPLSSHQPKRSYQTQLYSFQYPLTWSVKEGSGRSGGLMAYNPHGETQQIVNTRDRNRSSWTDYKEKILIDSIPAQWRKIDDQTMLPTDYIKYTCDKEFANYYPGKKNPMRTINGGDKNISITECLGYSRKFYVSSGNNLLEVKPFIYNDDLIWQLLFSIKFLK